MDKLHPGSSSTTADKPLLFPSDSELSRSVPTDRPSIKSPPVFRPHKPGTFTPDPYYSDSDSDLGEGEKVSRQAMAERKWTASTYFSDTTLVNARPERLRKYRGMGRAFERGHVSPILTSNLAETRINYGDKDAEHSPELNIGHHRIEPSRDDDKDWKPVFLKRSESLRSATAETVDPFESHDVTTARTLGSHSPNYDYSAPSTPRRGVTPLYAANISTPGLVPATPSLIYAMDRVTKAQKMAYAGGASASAEWSSQGSGSDGTRAGGHDMPGDGLPNAGERGEERSWKGFWADVQQKAAQS
ncbi:hypothetical protein FRC10_000852 [Ceratobasidium sp. 414]|nr:hypothetical protein FRC10_000852 [Ceratobasidium sp. 414]